MPYLLAVDQGTTSTTTLIVDEKFHVCGCASQEFRQFYPKPEYVEHSPDDIWQSALETIGTAIARARIDARQIAAIGIANQRETTVVWERKTGVPVYPAIVWQCRRTREACQALKSANLEPMIREKTGLLCDPYFSATKIRWILDRCDAQNWAENGDLCFGTIDSWLLWQLTQGASHATDPTNASRTLLMNLAEAAWDDDLLGLFRIPRAMMPEIQPNNAIFGHTKGVPGLPDGIPISGILGDQQAALFGQCCFDPGAAKCTFGTGAFLLLNTGRQIVRSQSGLISTAAWKFGDDVTYALEGSAFVAGAIVQWLRDGLKIIESSSEIEALARSVGDCGGVVVVPALTGLGAPHWRSDARGLICGLTRATTRAHIARAALMGICQQNTDLFDAMTADLGRGLTRVKVDGGASANDLLMQMQADLLGKELIRPDNLQTTALGAAMCASLGAGIYKTQDDVCKTYEIERRFEPQASDEWRTAERRHWKSAVGRA